MDFLITFSCYGSHLRGDARGSVDHIRAGEHRFLPPSQALEAYGRRIMRQSPYLLATAEARTIVRDAIVEVCRFRLWHLHGLHVRTNHAHGIVRSDGSPSQIVNAWKAYSTRRLRACGMELRNRLIWAHGANVTRLNSREALLAALHYVIEKQGEPMGIYQAPPSRARL